MSKPNKPTLRIGKLPDLTPVKLTVSLEPEVYQMLEDYTQIYYNRYGEKVKPAALVPSMITGFLSTDSGFKKARRELPR